MYKHTSCAIFYYYLIFSVLQNSYKVIFQISTKKQAICINLSNAQIFNCSILGIYWFYLKLYNELAVEF